MLAPIASGIVTGDEPVSYWLFFPLKKLTHPRFLFVSKVENEQPVEAKLGGSDVIKASSILHPLALVQQLVSLLPNKLTLSDNQ